MSELVSQSINNMQNGVSQQSAALRFSSQCEDQLNCRNDPVDGMGKRFNTSHVAALSGITDPSSYHIDTFERDETEQYKMFVKNGVMKVRDAGTGFDYTVTADSDALRYLALRGDISEHRAYQLLNTIDTTFVLNKTVPVRGLKPGESVSEPTSAVARTAIVTIAKHKYAEAANPDYTYFLTFTINGTEYTYNDASASSSVIAAQVATWIDTEYPTALSVTTSGHEIRVSIPSGLTPTISGIWDVTENGTEHPLGTGTVTTLTYHDTTVTAPAADAPAALWYIKQADYKTTYSVILNGTTCSIETPEATSARARAGLDTMNLTGQMLTAINGLTGSHGCTAVQHGNVLYIKRNANDDFSCIAHDDLGDRASYAVKEWASSMDEIPPNGIEGFRVEIRGEASDVDVDPYHIMYTELANDGTQTAGVWKETVKSGVGTKLDNRTMPLSLTRGQDAGEIAAGNPLGIKFTLSSTPFAERTVGDEITAPYPSFTSTTDANGLVTAQRHIKSMVFHKNRLGCIADENLIFSETGEYLNFFPTTVVTTLDADPIDVALNINEVAPVEHTLQHAGKLFLFAPKTQMVVTSGDVFNADSIDIDVLSNYRVDTTVAPFVHEGTIHFWSKGTKYSTLNEYLPQGDSERYKALPITPHVPTYVEGQVIRTLPVQRENLLLHLTRSDNGNAENHVYVTNIMMQGAERVQNAWQKWTFTGKIIDMALVKNKLSLVVEHTDGVFLEEITLSHDPLKEELGFPVFLDRREEVDENFTLPGGDTRVIYENKGRYWTGFRYQQKYEFSEFFVRDGERKAITGGRLQLRYLELGFHDTTNFTVTMTRGNQAFRTKNYEGLVIGSLQYLLGEVPTETGTERFPIHTRSSNVTITITNDTEHDAVFHAAEWEGTYTRRTRRM
ncbi:hypothetical protein [Amphritea sp. HPY]|uniref:phage nozzle protein n=1 Tax=Amphritea sp. HPY TaxID=3421652 RepID=UPI003D7EC318